MTTGVRSKISTDLLAVDEEIEKIDVELRQLKKRKQDLLEKKSKMQQRIENMEQASDNTAQDKWDNDGFSWSADANTTLQEVFKLDKFRPLQRAAINAVMAGEDAVVVMSTGGGKSLCYQLPAVLSKGLTLVVSPLISLVEDQLGQLRKLGVEAATLNASTSKEEVKRIEAAITSKVSDFRLLYVTPEKLAKSKRIMNKLEKSVEVGFMKLIAIDEVHCCSQWGHDFRTDYKFLNVLKRQFKGVPILGLTATATAQVLDDVKGMLGIPAAIVFRAGFNRTNLFYEVKAKTSCDPVNDIADVIKQRFSGRSGIVYCFSRKECEEVAKKLRELGIKAAFYHAYLEPESRTRVHEKWLAGVCQVIVATVAFGMGIDKPDVRFVIHHSLPKSIDNYYQESGRAGRDGLPSTCILFFRIADVFRQSTMVCTEQTGLNNLYSMVRFVTNGSTCRRSILAEHFEESWEDGWCQNNCDTCTKAASASREVDITSFMKSSEDVIREQLANSSKDGSGKITAPKLIDLLVKKTSTAKDRLERIVCHLLLEGFLQEDFHFTPYSIISYIQVGSKWKMNGSKPINMVENSGNGSPRKTTTTPVVAKKRKVIEESDEDDVINLE